MRIIVHATLATALLAIAGCTADEGIATHA
jgi:hypothetical protein